MRDRSVVEFMVMLFSIVVAVAILGLGALIIIVEARDPSADTGILASSLMSLVSGILGALLGLIAGRSEEGSGLHDRPAGGSNGLSPPPP